MTILEMKQRKKEMGYSYAQISELSGVPLGTVQKVFNGVTTSPRYDTLQALEQVFKEDSNELKETQTSYRVKTQGDYTLEDYYEIPEDIRVELIDGIIYTMSSPTSIHQLITGYIYGRLLQYVMEKKGKCIPMISPIDVQLDCDDKTMVQPDIIVVCDKDKVVHHCVYGAPDFIIEVLSKSTKKRDAIVKLNKYMNAGVKEYWMIDPERKVVIIYDFEHEIYPTIYGFDAKIPVNIWNGECVIDFAELYKYIEFLYEK